FQAEDGIRDRNVTGDQTCALPSSGNAINVAEAAAIRRYPGSIMSQSFGIPEILVHANNAQILQAHQNYLAAQAAGITVLASSGDFGATNGFGTANAAFPASDPLVTRSEEHTSEL